MQASLAYTASPETQSKIHELMSKAKEGTEKAKGELGKAVKELEERSGLGEEVGEAIKKGEHTVRSNSLQLEINLTPEIGQLLLSLLHGFGLDLDKVDLLMSYTPLSVGLPN